MKIVLTNGYSFEAEIVEVLPGGGIECRHEWGDRVFFTCPVQSWSMAYQADDESGKVMFAAPES